MERTHREDYLQAAMATPLIRGLPAAFVKDAAARGYAECFALAENYFCYLTERIHFLTGRIESIASPTVADKLLNYLAQNAENGAVGIPHGYNRLASTLSVSRASLYRVMDELEREGRIAREGKRILIKEVNHKE